jgi:hypothetical protein
MSLDFSKLSNPFLKLHLRYVENTEPPKMFHVWSAITSISACMQRHIYLDLGFGRVYGNLFVLLVGPPGTRKSTSIKFATRIMKQSTSVRWAPDDTGGQRQGLIAALTEDDEKIDGMDAASALDVETLMNTTMSLNSVNKHVMFIEAGEFGSFIGQNNLDLTRFLIKMWDGEDYDYRLKTSRHILKDNLMTLLGGTTPTDIASLLPAEAIGQGFMSRFVLVHAPAKEKSIPPSKARVLESLEPRLAEVYGNVFYNLKGPMSLHPDAQRLLDQLYLHEVKIHDTRFIYYAERRQTHLLKVCMCLAVARGSLEICQPDVEEAERILHATEQRMPEALGEYGLSPVAVAQQKMLEYLRHAGEPISDRILWVVMQRDMKLVDFRNSISALINSDKITALDTPNGRMYLYNDSVKRTIAAMDADVLDAILDEGRTLQ